MEIKNPQNKKFNNLDFFLNSIKSFENLVKQKRSAKNNPVVTPNVIKFNPVDTSINNRLLNADSNNYLSHPKKRKDSEISLSSQHSNDTTNISYIPSNRDIQTKKSKISSRNLSSSNSDSDHTPKNTYNLRSKRVPNSNHTPNKSLSTFSNDSDDSLTSYRSHKYQNKDYKHSGYKDNSSNILSIQNFQSIHNISSSSENNLNVPSSSYSTHQTLSPLLDSENNSIYNPTQLYFDNKQSHKDDKFIKQDTNTKYLNNQNFEHSLNENHPGILCNRQPLINGIPVIENSDTKPKYIYKTHSEDTYPFTSKTISNDSNNYQLPNKLSLSPSSDLNSLYKRTNSESDLVEKNLKSAQLFNSSLTPSSLFSSSTFASSLPRTPIQSLTYEAELNGLKFNIEDSQFTKSSCSVSINDSLSSSDTISNTLSSYVKSNDSYIKSSINCNSLNTSSNAVVGDCATKKFSDFLVDNQNDSLLHNNSGIIKTISELDSPANTLCVSHTEIPNNLVLSSHKPKESHESIGKNLLTDSTSNDFANKLMCVSSLKEDKKLNENHISHSFSSNVNQSKLNKDSHIETPTAKNTNISHNKDCISKKLEFEISALKSVISSFQSKLNNNSKTLYNSSLLLKVDKNSENLNSELAKKSPKNSTDIKPISLPEASPTVLNLCSTSAVRNPIKLDCKTDPNFPDPISPIEIKIKSEPFDDTTLADSKLKIRKSLQNIEYMIISDSDSSDDEIKLTSLLANKILKESENMSNSASINISDTTSANFANINGFNSHILSETPSSSHQTNIVNGLKSSTPNNESSSLKASVAASKVKKSTKKSNLKSKAKSKAPKPAKPKKVKNAKSPKPPKKQPKNAPNDKNLKDKNSHLTDFPANDSSVTISVGPDIISNTSNIASNSESGDILTKSANTTTIGTGSDNPCVISLDDNDGAQPLSFHQPTVTNIVKNIDEIEIDEFDISDNEPPLNNPSPNEFNIVAKVSRQKSTDKPKKPPAVNISFEIKYAYFIHKKRFEDSSNKNTMIFLSKYYDPYISKSSLQRIRYQDQSVKEFNKVKNKLESKYKHPKYILLHLFIMEWIHSRATEYNRIKYNSPLKPRGDYNSSELFQSIVDDSSSESDFELANPAPNVSRKARTFESTYESDISSDWIEKSLANILHKHFKRSNPDKDKLSNEIKLFLVYFQAVHNVSIWEMCSIYKLEPKCSILYIEKFPEIRVKMNSSLYETDPNLVFSVEETGLFFRLHENAELSKIQVSKPSDSNERLSLIACTNATGTKKIPLWVVGNKFISKEHKLNLFSNHNISYRSNSKAQITTSLFVEWLKFFDNLMHFYLIEYKSMLSNKPIPQYKFLNKITLIIRDKSIHPLNFFGFLKNVNVVCVSDQIPIGILPMENGITKMLRVFYKIRVCKELADMRSEEEAASKLTKKNRSKVRAEIIDKKLVLFSKKNSIVLNAKSMELSIPQDKLNEINLSSVNFEYALITLSTAWKTDMVEDFVAGSFGLFASTVNWKEESLTKSIEIARKIESNSMVNISILMKRLDAQDTIGLSQILNCAVEQNTYSITNCLKKVDPLLINSRSPEDETIYAHFKNGDVYIYDSSYDEAIYNEVNSQYISITGRRT
ncbi:ARS-binding protein 1 [Smittium culicis]|uniref:ARS-binding protein 1 n=1 Tax=Smittium culicis TaxID=133412 RepID=A0A1R1YHX5_9FUNG|nr:ARS-binding protein 1 [Smittium culicis]